MRRPPIYLSGVLTPGTLAHASRPELGVLWTPATNSYRRHLGAFGSWAIDNGCFTQGETFDPLEWLELVRTLPRGARFAAAPDVVGDAVATWARSEPWLEEIRRAGQPAALVAQDGLEELELEWSAIDALFIGGSTEWKLSPASRELMAEARARSKWVHVGRVNSWIRYRWAMDAGADSVDGTFLNPRFGGPDANLPRLLAWLDAGHWHGRQGVLELGAA